MYVWWIFLDANYLQVRHQHTTSRLDCISPREPPRSFKPHKIEDKRRRDHPPTLMFFPLPQSHSSSSTAFYNPSTRQLRSATRNRDTRHKMATAASRGNNVRSKGRPVTLSSARSKNVQPKDHDMTSMNATSTDLAINAPFDSNTAQAPVDRLAKTNRALRAKLWAYERRASERLGAQVRRIEGRALVTTPKKGVPDSGSWAETTARQQQIWLRAQNDAFSASKRHKALRFLAHAAFLRNEKRSVGSIRAFYKRKLRQYRGQSSTATINEHGNLGDAMTTSAGENADGAGWTNAALNGSQAGAHLANQPTSRETGWLDLPPIAPRRIALDPIHIEMGLSEGCGMASNSKPKNWAHEGQPPLNTDAGISTNKPSPKSDSIIIDLTHLSDTDDDDNGDTCRPSREAKR